jgi:hypothetical protein
VDYKVSPICDFPEYVLTGTEHNQLSCPLIVSSSG